MDKAALAYVLETARRDDINITQEQGRKSLGALGLSGQMALARIGQSLTRLHIAYPGTWVYTDWQTDRGCAAPLKSVTHVTWPGVHECTSIDFHSYNLHL